MLYRFGLPGPAHRTRRARVVLPSERISSEDEALTATICDVLTNPAAGISAVWVAGVAPEEVAAIAAAAAAHGLRPAQPA